MTLDPTPLSELLRQRRLAVELRDLIRDRAPTEDRDLLLERLDAAVEHAVMALSRRGDDVERVLACRFVPV